MRGYSCVSASMLCTPAFMFSVSSAPSVGSPDICQSAALVELTTTGDESDGDEVDSEEGAGSGATAASLAAGEVDAGAPTVRCSSDASLASKPARSRSRILSRSSPASGVLTSSLEATGEHTSPTGT